MLDNILEKCPIHKISKIEFYIVISDYTYIILSTYPSNNLDIQDWHEKVNQLEHLENYKRPLRTVDIDLSNGCWKDAVALA